MSSPLPWREHLTPTERRVIAEAEAAKVRWHRLSQVRAKIVRRACDRAARAIGRK